MTAGTDVNAQFDATRAGQVKTIEDYNRSAQEWNAMSPAQRDEIANQGNSARAQRFEDLVALGKMDNLGNGRYKVNDPESWDNGEVFVVQRAAGDLRSLLVLPETGLDASTGEVAFYSRTPEWHSYGTIIPSGLSSIPSVLRAARINFNVLQRPAGGWQHLETEAEKAAWYKRNGWDDDYAGGVPEFVFIPEDGKFQNYRDDTLGELGIVGKIHTAIQPAESMAFLQGLVNDDAVIVESAGALDGGKRIFISCLMPETMTVDASGIADEVQLYVAVFDRFDGQGQFQAVTTPWRPRCGNTERLALANAVTRWGVRHTTNARTRVLEAQRTLRLSNKYAEEFVAEETKLARNKISVDQFIALVDESFDRGDRAEESKKQTTVNDRRETALVAAFAENSAELGQTSYAAERAFTQYLDHAAPRRVKTPDELKAARVKAAFLGSDDDVKARVHKKLMTRTVK